MQNSDRRKVCFQDCLKDIDIQVIISYANSMLVVCNNVMSTNTLEWRDFA